MTLKQLEVFVHIADTGSFSRGADKSCITQSTASQHIHGLEEELGIRLFDRGRGGALLTVGGKLFYARAKKIISDCGESRAAIRCFLGMEDVVLKVGASTTPGSLLLPDILGQFISQYPGVRLDVSQGDSQSAWRRLIDEEVELAFIGTRYDDDRVSYTELCADEIVFVVSPSLLDNGKTSISQAGLCKVPLLVREQGSGTQKAVFEALARTWINRDALRIVAVMGSDEAIKRAVLNGCGYAFISHMAVSEELLRGELLTVRVPGVSVTRSFYAACREGREMSPAATAFLEVVLKRWSISKIPK